MNRRVIVAGAGVIGLTCAVRLAERGFTVDVLTREFPEETTSARAAGVCLPESSMTADPREHTWARTSLSAFTELAGVDGTGVRLAPGLLLPGTPEKHTDPRDVTERERPVVDLPVYLRYLRTRLAEAGGTLTRMALTGLPSRGIVVNATGLAARVLAEDPRTQPLRGQVVVLEDPGLRHWYACPENTGPLRYVVPVGGRVHVGGDGVPGTWDLEPDPGTADRLLDQARMLAPALDGATVRGHVVALRPVRDPIRVEAGPAPDERDPDRMIVHCYGHGARGVTLSWGCADQVTALVTGTAG
jgi:D-amino-acid oxidase